MGRRKTLFLKNSTKLLKSSAFLNFWCPWDILLFRSLCDTWPNFCIVGHLKSGFFRERAQTIGFIMLSVSVAYSASLSVQKAW